jgi:putative restriction endonuclease
MRINKFFETRLGTKLYNPSWSWGAYDTTRNRVFLRASANPSREEVLVYNPEWNPSPGHGERLAHLDAIRNGADGFIVVVHFDDPGEKIARFEEIALLVVGGLIERKHRTYALIVSEIPLEQLAELPSNPGVAAEDVVAVLGQKGLRNTVRQALVDARLGQGRFRTDVLALWKKRCAVTGVVTTQAVRASHIKPWRESSNAERIDPLNGLPLVATIDALFDSGLITFEKSGEIRISSKLIPEDVRRLSLRGLRLAHAPPSKTAKYLEFHAKRRFRA